MPETHLCLVESLRQSLDKLGDLHEIHVLRALGFPDAVHAEVETLE